MNPTTTTKANMITASDVGGEYVRFYGEPFPIGYHRLIDLFRIGAIPATRTREGRGTWMVDPAIIPTLRATLTELEAHKHCTKPRIKMTPAIHAFLGELQSEVAA